MVAMFVLLLGSYDHDTKALLYRLQERIAGEFVDAGCYSLLMEKLDLFNTSDGRKVVVERNEGENLTFYIFEPDPFTRPPTLEMIDSVPWSENTRDTLRDFLVSNGMSNPEVILEKTSISTPTGLFGYLVSISELYFIIRLKEETRGGEYLELCQITKAQNRTWIEASPNIFLYKRSGIVLSSMLDLILNEGGLVPRIFDNEKGLNDSVARVISTRV